MGRALRWVVASIAVVGCGCRQSPEARIRRALERGTGVVRLPAGTIEIERELALPGGAHDLEISGDPSGTTLHASPRFQGRAIFSAKGAARIRFSGFTIDGNRDALERRAGLPPYVAFATFYDRNGVLAENVTSLAIENVTFHSVAGFAVLIGGGSRVAVRKVVVENSGSRNDKGRNNTTGGILVEEGTEDFTIEECTIRNVRGNGIWTHSLYRSPRNVRGLIARNRIESVARDAIQVGHAVEVKVIGNSGRAIGYPAGEVDVEGGGIPVTIDTAGNVERSVYAGNRFEEVDGKCIDLDGFHDGEVRENACVNLGAASAYPFGNFGIAMNNANPDMRPEGVRIEDNEIDGALYGGILVIGTGNIVRGNRLRNLNLAHCSDNAALCGYLRASEPDFLRSGIYLARGAERPAPARGNRIEGNEITGYGMERRCIVAAPGVLLKGNVIRGNICGGRR